MTTATRSFEVLELLARHGVRFVVVGMTAGVLPLLRATLARRG